MPHGVLRSARLCCLLALLVPAAAAQTSSNTLFLTPGEPAERLAAGSDATQEYALYLPSGYTPEQRHPVLFLMDPRGRAMHPLGLFREAAQRHGYIVMSSYNTLSDADSAVAVNARALTAMIVDAQVRFNVDAARLYLVGFSGTAHYAWATAPELDGHLAGIVGVGDGMPPYSESVRRAVRMKRLPAYFAVAGTRDFNYDGARMLDQALDSTRVPHRFASFAGVHSWPPKAIAEAALEWLQLRAMRSGLAPRDDRWIDALCTAYLGEARALEQADAPADAVRRYREIGADCKGLEAAVQAKQRMEELAQDEAVRRALTRRDALARRVFLYKRSVRAFSDAYRAAEELMAHHQAMRRLQIASLRHEAADPTDRERSNAAWRMLASAYAATGFYEPRSYFEQENYARAAGMLRLAREIRPEAPRACYQLAQAAAQLKRTEEALEALACAVEGQAVRRNALEQDPLLKPLHGQARFRELQESALNIRNRKEDG